jgi:hypothetical protein
MSEEARRSRTIAIGTGVRPPNVDFCSGFLFNHSPILARGLHLDYASDYALPGIARLSTQFVVLKSHPPRLCPYMTGYRFIVKSECSRRIVNRRPSGDGMNFMRSKEFDTLLIM